MLALVADRLAILAWQKTKDGQKGQKQPAPYPRPGIKPTERTVKGEALALDKFKAKLSAMRKSYHGNKKNEVVTRFGRKDNERD